MSVSVPHPPISLLLHLLLRPNILLSTSIYAIPQKRQTKLQFLAQNKFARVKLTSEHPGHFYLLAYRKKKKKKKHWQIYQTSEWRRNELQGKSCTYGTQCRRCPWRRPRTYSVWPCWSPRRDWEALRPELSAASRGPLTANSGVAPQII